MKRFIVGLISYFPLFLTLASSATAQTTATTVTQLEQATAQLGAGIIESAQGIGVAGNIDVENIAPIHVKEGLVFSAKCLCGNLITPSPLISGLYRTAINIHNPNSFQVKFLKKVVISNPQRSGTRGQISQKVGETLGPNDALEIDCEDIMAFPGLPPVPFLKGFVVIEVPPQQVATTATDKEATGAIIVVPIPIRPVIPRLNVVGVYTYKNIEIGVPPPTTTTTIGEIVVPR